MIVDDRLLNVGSANLTNRSLNVDTELNATVESERADEPLGRSIRAARAALLGEHTGGPAIDRADGLVAHLDELARGGAEGKDSPCRLRLHPSPTAQERAALAIVDPQKLPFDPDTVEDVDDNDEERSVFAGKLATLWQRVWSDRDDTK